VRLVLHRVKMNFEIVFCERKNQLILYEKCKFYNKAYVKYLDANKWQCVNKKCTAKIYVDRDMKMIVKDESSHNHKNETDSVRNKKLFSNQLKRKCEDELERPSKIINTEIQKNPEQAQLFNGTDIYINVCSGLVDLFIQRYQKAFPNSSN